MNDKSSKAAASEKAKALAAALSQIEKQFGKGSVMRYCDNQVELYIQLVSTVSLGLDIALGVCVLPLRRLIAFYCPQSSVIPTLSLPFLSFMQQFGCTCSIVFPYHFFSFFYSS